MDIQAAIGQQAGVGRYARELAVHLARQCPDDIELQAFYFDFKRRGLSFDLSGIDARSIRWMPGRLAQKCWKTLHFPPYDWLAGSADLYHFPNFVRPPLNRGRSLVTIHDVSFLRHPETTEPKNLRYLKAEIGRTVQSATAIVTDSRFSREEIIECLDTDPDRVHAIHLGLKTEPADADRVERMRRDYGLDRPYLLFVSTIEPRKNIPFLLEVFERLEAFDGYLVMAGMLGWKCAPIIERMKTSSRSGDIRYIRYVPDEDLQALYAGAEAFVFPSKYEGFGLPPLEAMAQGTPVISSRGGSLPEVLGDAAVLLDLDDPNPWVREVGRVLTDTDHRRTQSQKGRARAARYRWEDTARETLALYRDLRP